MPAENLVKDGVQQFIICRTETEKNDIYFAKQSNLMEQCTIFHVLTYISIVFSAQFSMDRKQYCVKLSVQPSRGLMDEKFIVQVHNVPPGFQLTIHAFHKCDDGHRWEAFAHYTANAAGAVNGTWFSAYVHTTSI